MKTPEVTIVLFYIKQPAKGSSCSVRRLFEGILQKFSLQKNFAKGNFAKAYFTKADFVKFIS